MRPAEVLLTIGVLAYPVVCLLIGLRLAALGRKTGQLPERLVAISFLTAGFGANAVRLLAFYVGPSGGWLQATAVTVRALVAIGVGMMLIAAWRIFRPSARWARVLASIGILALVAYWLRPVLIGSVERERLLLHPFYWLESFALMMPYAWFSFESLRSRAVLRKQEALGLAREPGLRRRLLLFAMGTGSITLLFASLQASPVVLLITGRQLPIEGLIVGIGMFCAVCLWLAFFPPRSWRDEPGATAGAAAA